MTYRDRRLAKAERLREWARKREEAAAQTFKTGEQYRGDIAFNTQPGHIPERARLIAREDRAHESLSKARAMKSRAAGIEAAADHAIYSDDPDAVEALTTKIAHLETQRARMRTINAAIRKGLGWEARLAEMGGPLTEREGAALLRIARYTPYHCKNGVPSFPAYALSNLGGNISRLRKRLAQLKPIQVAPVDPSGGN